MLQNAAVKALVPRTLTPTWETWPMALALGSCPVWASGFLSRVVWARVNLWAPVQCEPLGSYPGWSRSAWASELLPRVVRVSVSLWAPAQGGPGQCEPLASCPGWSRPVWASGFLPSAVPASVSLWRVSYCLRGPFPPLFLSKKRK